MIKKSKKKKDESFSDILRSFLVAIILALIFRSFLFEPFHIPSGSMKSTLLVGDYIFVSKYSFGYSRYSLPYGIPLINGRVFSSEPSRGDVIVFKLPRNPSINYIKRVVGLPGDMVQVKEGILYINGDAVKRERVDDYVENNDNMYFSRIPRFVETLPNGVQYTVLDQVWDGHYDNTPVFTVPEGHYFFMGDNRDNSIDSRDPEHVGFVPFENLVGRASVIFFSSTSSLLQFWNWFTSFRYNRFFASIKYEQPND